jgi:hypothetical protein
MALSEMSIRRARIIGSEQERQLHRPGARQPGHPAQRQEEITTRGIDEIPRRPCLPINRWLMPAPLA